jgi:predicted MFS family arabinose efflux permease
MIWRYQHTTLLICTFAFFATMMARLVISPVVPDIVTGFDVSNAAVGLALSMMWGAYALTQFPSGILADRFGERAIILTALGGTGVASVLVTIAPSYLLFTIAVVLLGAVAGLHYSVATSLLARTFDETGRAIGIHVAGGPVAGLAAPIVATTIAASYGWRAAVLIGAVFALPTFFIFARFIRWIAPSHPDQTLRERLKLGPLVSLLLRPEIAYTTVLSLFGAFTWQATASFLPAFLQQMKGFTPATAGLLFSIYFLVHGASQPVIGSLSDRYSRDALVAVVFAFGVLGYGLLLAAQTIEIAVAAIIVVGMAMSWGAPLQSRFMNVLSDSEQGAGFALVRTVYMTLGASGSLVTGLIADLFDWATAFGFLAAFMSVGLMIITLNSALGFEY